MRNITFYDKTKNIYRKSECVYFFIPLIINSTDSWLLSVKEKLERDVRVVKEECEALSFTNKYVRYSISNKQYSVVF